MYVTDIHTLGCYTQHITSHTDTGAAATVYRIWPLLQCTESIIHTLHHQCSQCQTNLSSKPRTCITVLSTNPVHNVLLHLNYRFYYHTSRHTSFTILVLFRKRCDMLGISYKVKWKRPYLPVECTWTTYTPLEWQPWDWADSHRTVKVNISTCMMCTPVECTCTMYVPVVWRPWGRADSHRTDEFLHHHTDPRLLHPHRPVTQQTPSTLPSSPGHPSRSSALHTQYQYHHITYYPTARFRSPSSYMVFDEPFSDRSRSMSCYLAQTRSRPITFLWLWPATDHEPHCRHVPINKIRRWTESIPRSRWWWRCHMAGIYSDCSTREIIIITGL